ncbi:hypothetical protein JL721_4095 [Aureococcus anophagefferens]|nr:hypothetical protein JL721_4095 [Aureococcus anophagefferens]
MPRLARVALLLCSLLSSQDDCAAPADIAVFDGVLSDAALAALDAVLNTTRSRMIRIAAPPDDVAARTAAAVAASFGERGLLEVWSRDRYDPSVAFHFDMDERLNNLDLVAPPATLYIFCVDHDDDLAAPTTMVQPDGLYAVPRFEREYAKPRVPVLIRGWSLDLTWDSLVRTCGHLRPPLRTRGTSDAWAGLAYARGSNGRQGPKTLADVVSDAKEGGMLHEGDVFDWDATRPGGCGTLLETLVVPKYFSGALGFFGPGLFVQRNASGGGPHEDAFATSFWQYLAEGRNARRQRRRRFIRAAQDWADAHFPDVRCPKSPYARAFAGGDAADCGAPRPAELFGDVPGLAVREAVAEPGDLVYVPPTAPHQVRTLAPSLALSMNRLEAAALPDAQASLYVAAPESGFGYAAAPRAAAAGSGRPVGREAPWLQTLRGTLSRLQAHGEGLAALADRGKAAELGRPG